MTDNTASLPVTPYLSEICRTLKESPSRFLILTAQTGAGKSTAVPPALLDYFPGKILMLQPRRLAAVAVASRIAENLGEEPGQTAGYTLHLESRTSSATRLEVMTEAVLTRRLQNDPLLEGVSVIILDEFHERSVHADLVLAFLQETMQLRDDLYVIIMSATINAQKIASALATPPVPVMNIPGKLYPVEISYNDKNTPKQAVLSVLRENFEQINIPNERSSINKNPEKYRTDSILVFLPGIHELTLLKKELVESLSDSCEILILHSSIPLSEQKKVLSPVPADNKRRIILSSSIAETSVTVPGVRTVIDSGFTRFNRINLETGMNQLITSRITQFNADQRTGRAGRIMSGECIRLWNKNEQLVRDIIPEILRTDISSVVLECAGWGSTDINAFKWLDAPSKAAWNESLNKLKIFGFIKENPDGRNLITEKGKAALSLGISVRLACAALYGKQTTHVKEALDFVLKFSEYKDSSPALKEKFLKNLESRLSRYSIKHEGKFSKAELLLSGFPDRLAKKLDLSEQDQKKKDFTAYQFSSGRKGFLEKPYPLSPEFLIAPEVNAVNSSAKIFSYEPLSLNEISDWLNEHCSTYQQVSFDKNNSLKKTEITACGSIILKEIRLPVSDGDYGKALCTKIKTEGFDFIQPDEQVLNFLTRTIFYAQQKDKTLFEKLENLQENTESWLLPFINSSYINSKMLYDALYYYLDGAVIDREVPASIILPNGKKTKIKYEIRLKGDKLTTDSLLTNVRSSNIEPVIEVIIQQIFGCFETPAVLGVPVLLKLLSPARRPLQITNDLKNFWQGAWIEICKEMKGRYPKHNWDYRTVEKD
jgi:ATP-dependent helicase HrpB